MGLMDMAALVTVGVPAWSRREALHAVLADMVATGLHTEPAVRILVIDDDSPDGSFDAVRHFDGQGNISVRKNAERQGFRGNFIRLIEQCETEYLLYSCDDDFVVTPGVVRLLEYLKTTPTPPALISSLFYDKGQVYRANDSQVLPIPLEEYRHCCAHMPGLVLNARLARAIVPRIEPFLRDPRNAYPQCCVALLLLLFGYPGIYLPVELVRTGFDLASGIEGYATVAQRWDQFLFFDELLGHLAGSITDADAAARARYLLERHRASLFLTLGSGIGHERPDLGQAYLDGAAAWLRRQGA
ncbi:hypothetical protein GCM10007387_08880 [Pseudoduganella albidiflava]|uniref:Glycosyltransferase n=2 Tax=Pseudoduganella albidiflava TaxID=321983 RepID=A0A411X716_9BURK|nr:glycosyltransferase [Pseudoduganella albidiflava]GGY28892.1 hypothetical protein GCM10007387_08880 [Pseudoduganella albidiflava]